MPTTQPLIFDDTTNKQGICQDIDFACGSTLATFPKADKVRAFNLGLDEVAVLVESVSGAWNFEDSGQTDLNIATTDIKDGQVDYGIDTTFLSILGLYIKDSGFYKEITPIDRRPIIENDTQQTGTPTNYYLSGTSIYLYPVPDADITAGLKIHYLRNIKYVATDATTIIAGYNPQFYKLASLYASRDFAIAKGKSNLNVILQRIEKMEGKLKGSYARRNKTGNRNMKVGLDISNYM